MSEPGKLGRRNRITALLAGGLVVAMVGLAFASVPLYRLFCQVTGFSGTTQRADVAPGKIGSRVIRVQFNADVAKGLDWRFKPAQRELSLRVGEQKLAFYQAFNSADNKITGTATFNVTPLKAGAYFSKIDCFCFTEQTLAAGEKVQMPVAFFIDPEILKDRDMDDVKIITLSYTFFPVKKQASRRWDIKRYSALPEQKRSTLSATGGRASE